MYNQRHNVWKSILDTFGKANRTSHEARITVAMLEHCPAQIPTTGERMKPIVSTIDSPELTFPPGLVIIKIIGCPGCNKSKHTIRSQSFTAIFDSIDPVKNSTRFLSKVCSTSQRIKFHLNFCVFTNCICHISKNLLALRNYNVWKRWKHKFIFTKLILEESFGYALGKLLTQLIWRGAKTSFP